jgi:hypothetical protein
MFIELVLLSRTRPVQILRVNHLTKNLLWWSAGFAVVFTLIGLTWGKGSLAESWKSHIGEQFVPGRDRVEDHQFEPELVRNHVECVLAAAAGVGLALRRKRGREIAFPVALLLTDSLVHALHRPWWNYYYLHLAVPVTWLAGWAVNEILQDVLRLYSKYKFSLSSPATWKQLVLCVLLALVITRSELRLEGIVKDLRRHPSADANPIVKKMKEYAGRTHWVYSEAGLYAFHARLPMPPEIAVVTLKRFWSDQITTEEIVETCKRYQVEQLLLNPNKIENDWKDLLNDYDIVYQDTNSALYIAKRLNP